MKRSTNILGFAFLALAATLAASICEMFDLYVTAIANKPSVPMRAAIIPAHNPDQKTQL